MGVEYDLLDHAHREVFDLGKGPWFFLTKDELAPDSLAIGVAAALTQAEYADRFYRILNAYRLDAWGEPFEEGPCRDLGARVWAFFERSRWEAEVLTDQLAVDYEPVVYEVVDAAYLEDRVWCPYAWGTFPWFEEKEHAEGE